MITILYKAPIHLNHIRIAMPGNKKQSIEAELCKKLNISVHLTSYARGKLDIIPGGDTNTDQKCRECIITTAIEADKQFPKKRNDLPKHTDNTREGHDPEQSVDKDDQVFRIVTVSLQEIPWTEVTQANPQARRLMG